MASRVFRASRLIVMALALALASGCVCVGVGDLIDRLSSSHKSHREMCGMDHGRPTSGPADEHPARHRAENHVWNDKGDIKETK